MTEHPDLQPLEVRYQSELLFTHKQIFDQFAYNYSTYNCIVSAIYQPSTAYFVNLWTSYTDETAAQLKRQLEAMAAVYDPISNYDLRERALDGKKLDSETETTTPTGGTQTVSDLKTSGLNSTGDGAPKDHNTVTVTPLEGSHSETTREPANTQTGTLGSDTLTGHQITEHILQRSGNIGTVTAGKMVTEEYELRKISILRAYVKEFVDRYLYVLGGDSDYDCEFV